MHLLELHLFWRCLLHGLLFALGLPPKRGSFLRFLCLEPAEPDLSMDLLVLRLNSDLPPVDLERREVLEALRPPFLFPLPLDLALPLAGAEVGAPPPAVPFLASSCLQVHWAPFLQKPSIQNPQSLAAPFPPSFPLPFPDLFLGVA